MSEKYIDIEIYNFYAITIKSIILNSNTIKIDECITVYIESLCAVCSYQFFLQTKRDITEGRLPVDSQLAAELAAYAVQCKIIVHCIHS